jgi:hypothetical protein
MVEIKIVKIFMPKARPASSRKSSRRTVVISSPAKPAAKKRGIPWLGELAGIALIVLFGVFFIAKFLGWQVFTDARNTIRIAQQTDVEGKLHFTALKPDEDDKGEVHLMARDLDEEFWMDTGVRIPLQQDALWTWPAALPGVNYELQAVLFIDGKEIKKSEMKTITAPAYAVELPLEVNWRDLPADVVLESTTKLGGTVTINGHIPSSSVLEIYTLHKKHYEQEVYELSPEVLQEATKIATVTNPQVETEWVWNQAVPLEQYVVVAVLKDKNEWIGHSDQLRAADAGEEEVDQIINSTAQPSTREQVMGVTTENIGKLAQLSGAQTSASQLSGTVYLQGPKQKDTSLLMLWRKPGEQNYQVINRYMYPPTQGTSWVWNQAVVGQQYEVLAVLQVDEKNTSTAPNPIKVTAPASKINFTLNTWYVIPATSPVPVHEVCLDKSGNTSNAVIRLPKIANATQYWVQVGTDHGQAGVWNQKIPASDQDIRIKVGVENNKMNYVRYSYATCDNCSSDDNFAPFSNDVGFNCD